MPVTQTYFVLEAEAGGAAFGCGFQPSRDLYAGKEE